MKAETIVRTTTAKGKTISQTARQKIDWCTETRKKLIDSRPEPEKIVYDRLRKSRKTNAFIQQRFELEGHIYFADIYIAKYHIIIEIDGGYHKTPERVVIDRERDALCEKAGIRVYRITNEEVYDNQKLDEFMDIINSSLPIQAHKAPKLEDKHYKYLTTPNFALCTRIYGLRTLTEVNGKIKRRVVQIRKKDRRNKKLCKEIRGL